MAHDDKEPIVELIAGRAIPFMKQHIVANCESATRAAEDGMFGQGYLLSGRKILPFYLLSNVEKVVGKITDDEREEGLRLYYAAFQRLVPPFIQRRISELTPVRPKRDHNPNFGAVS